MKKAVTIFMLSILLFILDLSMEAFTLDSKVEAKETQKEIVVPQTIRLERFFLDGEVSIELLENDRPIPMILEEYKEWNLQDLSKECIYFQKYMDDISPLLKTNGYFGISSEGILSIYNGDPKNSKIIQSFFQINIEKLESINVQELLKGIKIHTKENYVQVLKNYQPFVMDEKG